MSLDDRQLYRSKLCKLAEKKGRERGGENPFGDAWNINNDLQEQAFAFEKGKLKRAKGLIK